MTGRERFLKIAKSELKGELFLPYNLNYAWFMEETIDRWKREGLPRDADPMEFFCLDRVGFTGGKQYDLVPPFEVEVISEDEETRVVKDELGITKRIFKKYEDSKMPQWIDFPVKSRGDFEEFKKRLDPHSPARYPPGWDERAKNWKHRDYPLGLASGSFFGHTLQRWVGTQNLCMLFYDDPDFVHEMLRFLEHFYLELIKKPLEMVEFDYASFGEDIAFKGRSFMSPAIFKEFLQPHYRSICEYLRVKGIEVIFVDSDGYLDELIPLWMEVGINAFSPLEVAAGEDALVLKEKFGKDIIIAGNIDKRALIAGKDAIDREVEKVAALLKLGGYFPAVDHSVPPDVPFENFCYLVERLKSL